MSWNWQLSFVIEDGKGQQSVHSLWLPAASTSVDIQEFTDLYIEELDPLIGGLIVSASVSMPLTTTGAEVEADKAAIFPISDVEEGAIFKYRSTNQFPFRHRIPTFLEGAFVSGTVDVDEADADVSDYVDAMIDGLVVTSGTLQPIEHRDEDLTLLIGGVENFTRSR
jgi:hypothetical protein